jgi:hypothetical protein
MELIRLIRHAIITAALFGGFVAFMITVGTIGSRWL